MQLCSVFCHVRPHSVRLHVWTTFHVDSCQYVTDLFLPVCACTSVCLSLCLWSALVRLTLSFSLSVLPPVFFFARVSACKYTRTNRRHDKIATGGLLLNAGHYLVFFMSTGNQPWVIGQSIVTAKNRTVVNQNGVTLCFRNFAWFWPIFEILSPLNSTVNSKWRHR